MLFFALWSYRQTIDMKNLKTLVLLISLEFFDRCLPYSGKQRGIFGQKIFQKLTGK